MIATTPSTRRQRYYGWHIIGAVCVTLAFVLPFRFWVFGIFLKYMTEDLGWSRTALGGAYSVSMILGSILSPFVGRLIDHYGPRVTMAFGAIVAAVSLVLMAFLTEIWQVYVLFGIAYTIGETLLGLVPTSTTVSRWFVRRRGFALGIVSMASSVGALALMPLMTLIIVLFGWRVGFIVFAVLILAVITPTVWRIMRKSPEEMGLLPDGEPVPPKPVGELARELGPIQSPASQDWRPREAARSAAFWIIGITFGFASGAAQAISVHFVAFSGDLGYSPESSTGVLVFLLVIGLPGRLLFGWLTDHMDKRLVIAIYQIGLVISLVLFPFARSVPLFYLAAAIYAVACGGFQTVPPALAAELFGRRFLGAILGYQQLVSVVFIASAIVFSDYSSDTTGSYSMAFYVLAVAVVVVTASLPFVRVPRRHHAPAHGYVY